MYKGGYQILDLTGYDLTTDEENLLTNEVTINYLVNFAKNYNRKPILLKMNDGNNAIIGLAFSQFNKLSNIFSFQLGVYTENYGYVILFTILLETNKIVYEKEEL